MIMDLTEHQEAILLAEYLDLLKQQGKIELYSHLPHETYTTSWSTKRKNKAEGVKKGVPDYIIVTKKNVLFIELKKVKGSVISQEQHEWRHVLENKKTIARIAYGFEDAKRIIDGSL